MEEDPTPYTGHSDRRSTGVHQVEWIAEPGRFAELGEQWDRLAARQLAPFGRHAWFWAWWNAFGARGQLRVCAVWRGERLVAALPLWRRGGVLRAMANVHTPIFQIPASDDGSREAALSAALHAAPDALELEALASTDPALPALARDSRGAGRAALVESLHTSPIIDLKADFAAYIRLHPTRCRKLAKLGRKMRRDHEAEVALLEAPSDLEAELERAFALEGTGWKGAAGQQSSLPRRPLASTGRWPAPISGSASFGCRRSFSTASWRPSTSA